MKEGLTLLLVFSACAVFCQIKSKDLIGSWITSNEDSLYHKASELILYQDINYTRDRDDCYYVNWKISSRKNLKIESLFSCTEPGRVSSSTDNETFDLKCENDKQIIVLKRKGTEIDCFLIVSLKEEEVDRYPHNIKILTLKRQ